MESRAGQEPGRGGEHLGGPHPWELQFPPYNVSSLRAGTRFVGHHIYEPGRSGLVHTRFRMQDEGWDKCIAEQVHRSVPSAPRL
jgi:hypothetical protein